MARLTGFKRFLCAATVTVWALGGSASPAEPLRLVTSLEFGFIRRRDSILKFSGRFSPP